MCGRRCGGFEEVCPSLLSLLSRRALPWPPASPSWAPAPLLCSEPGALLPPCALGFRIARGLSVFESLALAAFFLVKQPSPASSSSKVSSTPLSARPSSPASSLLTRSASLLPPSAVCRRPFAHPANRPFSPSRLSSPPPPQISPSSYPLASRETVDASDLFRMSRPGHGTLFVSALLTRTLFAPRQEPISQDYLADHLYPTKP